VRGAGAVLTNTAWYASTGTSGPTSAILAQRVSAKVRLLLWSAAGLLAKLSGSVSPAHRGEKVALQQHTSKGWSTIATSVIGRLSKFTVRHRFAHRGNVQLRAVFGGDARNAKATSGAIVLRIS
jgi:hypothetical protein